MDSYQFYKSVYDRELNRRKDLDSAINLPLTLLTILVAANSYIYKQATSQNICCIKSLELIFIISFFLTLSVTIFYLTRSYNNLFKGFAYKNLGLTEEVRKYEIDALPKYNKQLDDQTPKLNFEDIIIEKLNSFTDNHIIINDKRSYDLYLAKTVSILGLIITALNFLFITIKTGSI